MVGRKVMSQSSSSNRSKNNPHRANLESFPNLLPLRCQHSYKISRNIKSHLHQQLLPLNHLRPIPNSLLFCIIFIPSISALFLFDNIHRTNSQSTMLKLQLLRPTPCLPTYLLGSHFIPTITTIMLEELQDRLVNTKYQARNLMWKNQNLILLGDPQVPCLIRLQEEEGVGAS